jgi:hypothetical protein
MESWWFGWKRYRDRDRDGRAERKNSSESKGERVNAIIKAIL